MPLYRVTLEFEAYCWFEEGQEPASHHDMTEEVLNRHAHAILSDQGPFDSEINVQRVNKIEEIPEEWQNAIAYGDDEERTIKELMEKPND